MNWLWFCYHEGAAKYSNARTKHGVIFHKLQT